MIYKATDLDTRKLLSMPETGMGYQVIEAILFRNHSKGRFVVYNAELAVDLDDRFSEFKGQIIKEGISKLLKESEIFPVSTQTITLVSRNSISEIRMMSKAKEITTRRASGGKGAIDNPKEKASGDEVFVRLSAYEDDKRIDDVNKCLLNGTYTTTHSDYSECVKVPDDPIDRYALPNNETITWAFYIRPKHLDWLQRGIVQPAFQHDGGGIEAYFEQGTSVNTYFDKRPYGK